MILYFSGTGNSKYVAKRIADALGDEIVNLNARIKASDTSPVETDERLIIVTPTYAWRIPRVVRDWLLKTELHGAKNRYGLS
ncbi:MAG: EFR1 family ferrodoxin [Oscillospiraceae bacterium]